MPGPDQRSNQRSSDSRPKAARKRSRRDDLEFTDRRAIVILGMHRSGTSALAGVLGRAGAGLPANLMPATPANPRGYFESQLLYELHEEIFADAGVTWQDLLPPPPDWFRSGHAARFVDRLCKAVLEEFGDAPLMVLKDPRVCRLVPLWTRVFQRLGVAPCYVIAVRHPLEVAASLEREHQMDPRKATLLWLDHLLRAEHDTRGQQRTVVSYDHLLTDWRGMLTRVGTDLDLPFPRLSRRIEAEIDDFLSSKLRHHGADRDALAERGDIADWVKDAYAWAQRASAGESPDTDRLDAASEALLGAERAFGPLLAAAELARSREAEEVQRLVRAIDGWRDETKRRDDEIARIGGELRNAETEVSIRATDVDRMREELAERQHHLERIVDWVKVLLQWTAQVTSGRAAPQQSLELVFRALDSAAPAQLPAVATSGLEVAVHSAEAASLREQLADVLAESKQRAEAVAVLQSEGDAVRAEAAASRKALIDSRSEVEELERKLAVRTQEAARLDRESAHLRAELEVARERAKQADAVAAQLATARSEIEQKAELLRGHAAELVRARAESADRGLLVDRLKARLGEIERSLSWRAGRPARAIGRAVDTVLRK